jgi:hypothetical protein
LRGSTPWSGTSAPFDAIGDEIGGARYPAVAFVEWLAAEWRASAPAEKPAEREAA